MAYTQNEQRIRDIEKYVAKIDSLINCCSSRCFEEIIACGDRSSTHFFSVYSPINKLDSILCHENSAWDFEKYKCEGKVVRQKAHVRSWVEYRAEFPYFGNVTRIFKTYYQAGEFVAVVKEQPPRRVFREGNVEFYIEIVVVLYINDGKVIYQRGLEKNVKSVIQRYNLQFYQGDCGSSPQ